MPRFEPIPDPSGSLKPPKRNPPTAVATATPDPAPRHHTATATRGMMATVRFAFSQVAAVAERTAKRVVRALART